MLEGGVVFKVEIHTEELDEFAKDLEKELKSVKGAKAGWYKGQKYPDKETKGKKKIGGIEIAKNALIQEYGTDKIPPRPFMRRTIEKHQKEWIKFLNENFDAELNNNVTLEQIMRKIGAIMAGDMKKTIGENLPPPNAPETIKRKGGRTHTLEDTLLMKNSIHSGVIKK